MQNLNDTLAKVILDTFGIESKPEITRPDEQFGDYATNVAMQLAGRLRRNPREVAEELASRLREIAGDQISDISIAGPGFINIKLSDETLGAMVMDASSGKPETYKAQVVIAEYSDPNPFKVLHVGHLYTSVIGDAISNLVRVAGGEVHAVNFGGDVGLHVGKTMWAIIREFGGEAPEKLAEVPDGEHAEWMARCYVAGTQAYDDDEAARAEIIGLNKRVYKLHQDEDKESDFAQIYWTCREWSYEYFDAFYDRIGSKFEKYYPESSTAPLGLETVQEQLAKGVYEKSDDAVVFNGEKYGLHTRVFINSHGLPTYEAKDVGLIMSKWQDYSFDHSIVITGNDITEYMKVVLKSIEQFAPKLSERTTHVTHGNVKLAGGVKMSSRKGNFLRAVDVIDLVAEASRQDTGNEQENESTVLGAIKYAFLKQRIGADVVFIPEESVSTEGNSGPYLQYAHARARSILSKSQAGDSAETLTDFTPGERSLARKISEYPDVIQRAVAELMPHHVCTYLYELAQVFNRFYEQNHVIGDEREAARLKLVEIYANILKDGLSIMGIDAPDRM